MEIIKNLKMFYRRHSDSITAFFAFVIIVLVVRSCIGDAQASPIFEAHIGLAAETGNTFVGEDDNIGVGVIRLQLNLDETPFQRLYLEYEHHSNATEQDDRNSYDAIGIIWAFKFGNTGG